MTKRLLVGILLTLSFVYRLTSVASDVDAFVDSLNAAWVTTNYTACLSNINSRLSVDTNDLSALVAKACYFVFVDADFESATNVFAKINPLVDALSVSNKADIVKLYEDLRDDITTCLSVPMVDVPPEEQKQYVRNQLYPTNFPEQVLLRMLDTE